MSVADTPAASRRALPNADAAQTVHSAPRCGRTPQGGTSAAKPAPRAPEGRVCAPPDLAAFLVASTTSEVARALQVSRGTAHRLTNGYWPADARALVAAWDAYRGRSASQRSDWFLRRVYPGGLVRHAGKQWSAPSLDQRIGQTLAVARADGEVLLAQTLEMPPRRLSLSPVSEGAAA